MSTTKEAPKCGIDGCGGRRRAKGLCSACYQAHFVRGMPISELIASKAAESPPYRLQDPVEAFTRIERADDEKLRKLITSGKVREKRYAFLQRVITEAIRSL
jgi:hypothetical protein